MSDLTPSLVVHQNHCDLSTYEDQESYGITTSPQDVPKPHGSSSGHPFTWISQPYYEKYSFYTEVPNQHLKVITKKQKCAPVEVEFLLLNSLRFFVTMHNLIYFQGFLQFHKGFGMLSIFCFLLWMQVKFLPLMQRNEGALWPSFVLCNGVWVLSHRSPIMLTFPL